MNSKLKTSFSFILFIFTSLTQAETTSGTSQTGIETGNSDTGENAVKNSSKPKQYYIIEVVLFKHLNEQGKNDEFWSRPDTIGESTSLYTLSQPPPSQTITDDMPALAQYDLQNKRFLPLRNGIAVLSPSNYRLSDSAAHLRYSSNYQLLAHFGWTQRSLSKSRALPVALTSRQFSDSLTPSGELKLYVSRYLHMQVDLAASKCEYQADSNSNQANDAQLDKQLADGTTQLETQFSTTADQNGQENIRQCVNNTYRFKQKRKMRSKELHYMDNPVFGMLVYVTPFTVN